MMYAYIYIFQYIIHMWLVKNKQVTIVYPQCAHYAWIIDMFFLQNWCGFTENFRTNGPTNKSGSKFIMDDILYPNVYINNI